MSRRLRGELLALPAGTPQSGPLHRQVYAHIRAAILSGRFAPGTRLPATRTLAAELGVARNTVLTAFEQLAAEGYLQARVGSGTFVAGELPGPLGATARVDAAVPAPAALSQRGARLLALRPPLGGTPARAFAVGVPATDAFPLALWQRLLAARGRERGLLDYAAAQGHAPLRIAIARHLTAARGVVCAPEQVIVLAATQQGLDLIARVLADPGDVAWLEEPGYRSVCQAWRGQGLRVEPVAVDAEGLNWQAATHPPPRLIYVTPSHQFPSGVVMSLPRRLALLERAVQDGAWIVEDDYDSEFRYAGRPLAALQGLDGGQRVLYLGTFAKSLFPGLRLAWLVVPPALVEAFVVARRLLDYHSPPLLQAVTADFIDQGHFAAHIRRMRGLYAERQAALLEAARRELAGAIELTPADTGLHLLGRLQHGRARHLSARAAVAGIALQALDEFHIGPCRREGLLFGYAATPPEAMHSAVQQLAALID